MLSGSASSPTRFEVAHGQCHVPSSLPPGFDSTRLLEAAAKEGVVFSPGIPFYINDPDVRTVRLSFTTYDPDHIREGPNRLARAVDASSE